MKDRREEYSRRRRKEREQERERKKNRKLLALAGSVTLIICLALIVQTIKLNNSNLKKEETYESLQVEATKESKKGDALEESKEYVTSDDYIESVARERLNLANEDEIIVQPKEN